MENIKEVKIVSITAQAWFFFSIHVFNKPLF